MLTIKENISLAALTTIQLGGKARFFCECIDEEELLECLEYAKIKNLNIQVLGGGSNIIFPDNDFNGLVLKIGIKGISVYGKGDSNEVEVTVRAGEDWDNFVMFCTGEGLQGIECLSGIPGSTGATPVQNVGAYGQEVSRVIIDVTAIERSTMEKKVFTNQECQFGYRQSRFKKEDKDKYIITEVRFKLIRNGEPEIKYPELIEYLEKIKRQEVTSDATSNSPDTTFCHPEFISGSRFLLKFEEQMLKQVQHDKFPDRLVTPDATSNSPGKMNRQEVTPDATSNEKLENVRKAVIEIRRNKSMVIDSNDQDSISCGSFFMNPVLSEEEYRDFIFRSKGMNIPYYQTDGGIKISAAFLIEKAGYGKGYKKSGAGISSKHTLALINCGGTTKDILNLAEEIESKVSDVFGIKLKREPVIIN